MKRYVKNSETILGHARSLSDIGALLEDHTELIIRHLAKLYLFPDAQEVRHWRKEVATFLNSVPLRKHTNKLPKANFIFHNTFEVNEPYISSYYNAVYLDYIEDGREVTSKNPTLEDFTLKVKSYYIWLSNNLSRYKILPNIEIINKLKELGF